MWNDYLFIFHFDFPFIKTPVLVKYYLYMVNS
nr:MAG TPA: hypothetical protein [Caudoviricetes sp.]